MIPDGVSIILSPAAVEAWREAGSNYLITNPHYSPFVGRFIGVKLSFPWLDQYERKVWGHITLFVVLGYHPLDEVELMDFFDTMSSIMSSVPKLEDFIGGHDANTNIIILTKTYRQTLVPWGIYNRDMKGIMLIGLFGHKQLKVTNSLFNNPSFVTWRSFRKARSPHMLDVISVSEIFLNTWENAGFY